MDKDPDFNRLARKRFELILLILEFVNVVIELASKVVNYVCKISKFRLLFSKKEKVYILSVR